MTVSRDDDAPPAGPPRAAPPPLPDRHLLWSRSVHATHALWMFFYAGLFTLLLLLGSKNAWDDEQYLELGIFWSLLLMLIGSASYKLYRAKREVVVALRILKRGALVEGRVVSIEHRKIKDSRTPIQFSMGWIATYAYRDPEGAARQGKSGFLSEREAQKYRRDSPVRIAFDPDRPERSVWAEPSAYARNDASRPHPPAARISPRAVAGLLLAVVAGSAALVVLVPKALDLGGSIYDEAGFLWRDGEVRLRPLDELGGIRLGESVAEAKRRAGPFEPDGAIPGKAVEDYAQPSGPLNLWTRDQRIAGISHDCRRSSRGRINRIACGASERRIKEVFGPEVRVLCAKVADNDPRKAQAEFARAYDVQATGTRYVVERGRVTGLTIMAPEDLRSTVGRLWHPC